MRFHVLLLVLIGISGTFCPAACPVGDLDGNCSVGIEDLVVIANSWLTENNNIANLNGTGLVDMADFSILANHWSQTGYPIVINEVMSSNSGTIEDPDEAGEYPDWIELYNPSSMPVDIGGMWLTDTLSTPKMCQIPTTAPAITTIEPGGYLIIWADDDPSQGPLHVKFKLSAGGEAVGLFDSSGGVIDTMTFGSQTSDESYGRYPNGGPGWQKFKNGTATPGSSNGGESADLGIVISEIMYHPGHDEAAFEPEPTQLEFIEIANTDTSAVDLGGWRLVDGVAFTVPADTVIAAGGYLVIAADTAAFSALYSQVTNVVGGWSGKLSNKGERITLVNTIGTVIDVVRYCDDGDWAQRYLGPVDYNHRGWKWSDSHDGGGKSLELVCDGLSNEYGQNWKASLADGGTPGSPNSVSTANAAPLILDACHSPIVPNSSQPVTVTARIIDELNTGLSVVLYWHVDTSVFVKSEYPVFDASSYTAVTMFDDGLHGDGQSGDGIYGAVIPAQANDAIIEFFVEATDSTAHTRTWPAPCDMDGVMQQMANMLYQVDDSFASDTAWVKGKQPMYYIIMTEAQRGRLEEIGDGDDSVDERYSNAQMNATFISVDGTGTQIRYGVDVRNRGEGSRKLPPNNYRVGFRRDCPWKEVWEINLNSKYTYLQLAGSAIFQTAGLVAANATAVQVRVNGENLSVTDSIPARMYGTYVHMEAINSEFADGHFADDGDGNVYKASIYPQIADLTYLGTDPAAYVTSGYSKATNESENDWNDLFELTNVLENEPDATYLQRLSEVVNTDQWIRWYAVQVLIGNNETNLGTGYGDDYRMYRGIKDPRFVLITHDNDTILGLGDSPASATASIWLPIAQHSAVQMAVTERFLQHPQFVWKYYAQLEELAETVFAPATIDPLLDSLLGGFVPDSQIAAMKQFVVNRRASVLSQIPRTFTATTSLSTTNGYYKTTSATVSVSGTADAAQTLAVRANGQLATWAGVTGTWSCTGLPLKPGINRITIQAFGDSNGTGTELDRMSLDVWYDDSTQSTLTGTLTADTVLDAASGPWRITGDVVIPAGVTLTIEAGTTLFFNAGTGITVNGKLIAEASEYARIRLTRVPGGTNWDGLALSSTTQDSRLRYVDMEYGDIQGESIMIDSAKVTIDHSTWANTSSPIISAAHPQVVISNCVFPSLSTESILGQTIDGDNYLTLTGNIFNAGTGTTDIVKLNSSGSDKIFVKASNNVFYGGGGNGFTLSSIDAWLEGNLFVHFHKNASRSIASNAIAAEKADGTTNLSDVWAVRNIFYDNDHAILLNGQSQAKIVNNTLVKSAAATIAFWEDRGSSSDEPAAGADIAGCIFDDYTALLAYQSSPNPALYPDPVITINQSIIPTEQMSLGTGNLNAAPLFVKTGEDFQLISSSPAVGTGPNGQDMGRYIPSGAVISGEPAAITYQTTAALTVGGAGITYYKWRLKDNEIWSGNWSSESAVSSPIALTGLQNGHTYQVYAMGKNAAGDWTAETEACASKIWQIDSTSKRMVINEILAGNTTLTHEGTLPDMIELYYDGYEPMDLTGYKLSDNKDVPDKFVFGAGIVMNPGTYLVIYADSSTTSGIHAGFALSSGGDNVILTAPSGEVVDSIAFGPQLPDRSIGRIGWDGYWTLTEPTFGSANTAAIKGDPRTLKINEWLADSDILFDGDWLEIYNPDSAPVDMGGFYVTDDPVTEPNKCQLRPLSFVAGSGYVKLADDITFGLSADGEMLGLYDADLNLIDMLIYGPQGTDISQGRSPDGSDTLAFFGLPTPGASNEDANTIVTTVDLINIDDVWSYNQARTDLGTAWRAVGYDDSAWSAGAALLYVETASLPAAKNTPLTLGANTYYFRKHFTFSGNPNDVEYLQFSTVIDDGAVVYLNGNRILSVRLGDTVTYSTVTTTYVGDAGYEYFTAAPTYLVNGDNVIAVEVHQSDSSSSDIVFGLKLDAVTTSTTYEDNYNNDRAVLKQLRITEIMYNPAADGDAEYIELQNIGETAIDLKGIRLTGGIDFVFPAMTLTGGQYMLVIAQQAAFEARYGTALNVAGVYDGKLDNSGEDILLQLANPLDAAILRFDYKDGWYPLTDGQGHSLVIVDPAVAAASWQTKAGWRPSTAAGGSPGRADTAPVIINEVLAHSHDAAPDWIELYNTTDTAINLGGWTLSDNVNNLAKYPIAANTVIGPYSYLVFYQDTHFGSAFALSENGESVYLTSNTGLYTTEVHFGASETGVSFGRYETSDGINVFVLMSAITAGDDNALPKTGSVIISEIMYNPPAGGAYPADDYEYIELHNITSASVALDYYDSALGVTLGWKFTDGIDFSFPTGLTIPANGYLVIARNPEAFAVRYGSPAGVQILGPFENATALSNDGQRIELSKPGDTDTAGVRYYIAVDAVHYYDQAPWPAGPDGQGQVLGRIDGSLYGDDVTNWQSQPATPGL